MQRILLGNTGLECSVLGFGTAGLLRAGGSRHRQSLLAAALDSGLTHFDTAPIYGLGEAERALGCFARTRRSRITLTTKFGLAVSRKAAWLSPVQRIGRLAIRLAPGLRAAAARRAAPLYRTPDYQPAIVRRSLEASLRALGSDHVDLFLAHEASVVHLPGQELLALLERLRAEGKLRAWGIASSFERALPVLNAEPSLGMVAQTEADLAGVHVAALRTVAQAVITHGSVGQMATALRRQLEVHPDRERHARELLGGADPDCIEQLAPVLLRCALLHNPGGVVLTQTTAVAHIRRNAASVADLQVTDAAQNLAAWLRTLPLRVGSD